MLWYQYQYVRMTAVTVVIVMGAVHKGSGGKAGGTARSREGSLRRHES